MIQTIDLKKGMVFEKDGKLLKVLAINHHKPGKGNTVMNTQLKNVADGPSLASMPSTGWGNPPWR